MFHMPSLATMCVTHKHSQSSLSDNRPWDEGFHRVSGTPDVRSIEACSWYTRENTVKGGARTVSGRVGGGCIIVNAPIFRRNHVMEPANIPEVEIPPHKDGLTDRIHRALGGC